MSSSSSSGSSDGSGSSGGGGDFQKRNFILFTSFTGSLHMPLLRETAFALITSNPKSRDASGGRREEGVTV